MLLARTGQDAVQGPKQQSKPRRLDQHRTFPLSSFDGDFSLVPGPRGAFICNSHPMLQGFGNQKCWFQPFQWSMQDLQFFLSHQSGFLSDLSTVWLFEHSKHIVKQSRSYHCYLRLQDSHAEFSNSRIGDACRAALMPVMGPDSRYISSFIVYSFPSSWGFANKLIWILSTLGYRFLT